MFGKTKGQNDTGRLREMILDRLRHTLMSSDE